MSIISGSLFAVACHYPPAPRERVERRSVHALEVNGKEVRGVWGRRRTLTPAGRCFRRYAWNSMVVTDECLTPTALGTAEPRRRRFAG